MKDRKLSEHFKNSEFACKCKCKTLFIIDPSLITFLERVREYYGLPVTIDSGFRCFKRNKDVGGSPRSQHLYGRAADFHIEGVSPDEVADWCAEFNLAGGVGRYDTFTHVDMRGTIARWDERTKR